MADNPSGITVLISTNNRAAMLRQTLEAFTCVDQTGIDCSIVIIDNNSNDNTAEVVKEYETRLPISYLREQRPGKNCALNKALRECSLKEIVVFTDDDVSPAWNWFQEIVSSAKKWPGVGAFGGKIELIWPDNKQPEWAVRDWLVGFAFPRHHYAEGEAFYKPRDYPLGPNYWVRKLVFEKEPFFNETLGPRPRNRIVGDEAAFLINLQERGFQILYYPQAVVYHRSLPEAFTLPWLRHRAYKWGEARIRLYGWHRLDLYRKSKVVWCMVLIAEEFYNLLRFLTGFFLADLTRNCERTVTAMIMFGELHETANQIFKRFLRRLKLRTDGSKRPIQSCRSG